MDSSEETALFLWDQERPHPLCIPHIVDNILSSLDIPSLRACRLVNSQYDDIASRKLSKKERITFNKTSHLTSYLSLIKMMTKTNMNNDNTNKLQHTRFHFNFDPDTSITPTVEGALDTFFTTVGKHITELSYTTDLIPINNTSNHGNKSLLHMGDIWRGKVANLETLRLEVKWGCPSKLFECGEEEYKACLPSVKKLVLDIVLTEREADERAPQFLRQLLTATCNVEEITIPGEKKFMDDYVNVILTRIILSPDINLKRLASLNFCLALSPSQVLELAQKDFPLKSLILDFTEVQHHYASPNQFMLGRSLELLLARTAQTMQNLRISFPFNADHPLHRFAFPEKMMGLESLALGRFCGSVGILDNLPLLKKLDLWNVRWNDFQNDEKLEEEELNMVVPTQYLGMIKKITVIA